LTPVQSPGPGHGLLHSSDVDAPLASNVNFTAGSVDPNLGIARIGADGKVCFTNSEHNPIHLVADNLGAIKAEAYTPALPSGAPKREVDTREEEANPGTGSGLIVQFSCNAVPVG